MTTGFSNWKKALEKFAKHECSHTHKESMLKLSTVNQENVVAALDVNAKKQQKRLRTMLDKQIFPHYAIWFVRA